MDEAQSLELSTLILIGAGPVSVTYAVVNAVDCSDHHEFYID